MTKNQETIKQITCFVIMPFSKIQFRNKAGENISLSESQLTHIYKELFKKAIESYGKNKIEIKAHRYEQNRGNFTKGIVQKLDSSDLVVADLTGLNPNVFYELGIRHTLRVGTLLVTQNIDSLPSDLRNYIAIEYKYPSMADEFARYYTEFENKIHAVLDEFFKAPRHSDNPVYDFLLVGKSLRYEQRIADLKQNIQLMEFLMCEYIDGVVHFIQMASNYKKTQSFPFVDYPVTTVLQRLVNQNESMEVILFLNNLAISLKLNNENCKILLILSEGEIESQVARDRQYGYRDRKGLFHHIADLKKKYHFTDNGKKTQVTGGPIVNSFLYFIKAWKEEFSELLEK